MNKIVTTLLISSLALGGTSLANASENRHGHDGKSGKYCKDGGKGYGIERMTEHLGLNKKQTEQVRSIRESYHKKFGVLRDKSKAIHEKLHTGMHADDINQAQVKKLAQAMGQLKADKIILRSEMNAEIHKVLTREQREKMKNWKGHRKHKQGHGHKGHHDSL